MHLNLRIHQQQWAWPDLVHVWTAADEAGIDSASLMDLFGTYGAESMTALTFLTARTERIAAMPFVLAAPYRHPALVAKAAATLDVAAPGRIIVGIGAGGADADAAMYGQSFPKPGARVAMLEEQIQLMRILWTGGGDFAGEFYQLHDAVGMPEPATPGGPRVLVGGSGPKLLGVVGRQADIANSGYDLGPDGIAAVVDTIAGHAAAVGRPTPDFWQNCTVIIGRNDAEVDDRFERWRIRQNTVSAGQWQQAELTPEAGRQRLQHALMGTPEQIGEKLGAFVALGVPGFNLYFDDLPDLESFTLFTESVLPSLR